MELSSTDFRIAMLSMFSELKRDRECGPRAQPKTWKVYF